MLTPCMHEWMHACNRRPSAQLQHLRRGCCRQLQRQIVRARQTACALLSQLSLSLSLTLARLLLGKRNEEREQKVKMKEEKEDDRRRNVRTKCDPLEKGEARRRRDRCVCVCVCVLYKSVSQEGEVTVTEAEDREEREREREKPDDLPFLLSFRFSLTFSPPLTLLSPSSCVPRFACRKASKRERERESLLTFKEGIASDT